MPLLNHPLQLIAVLVALSLLPFFVIIGTSFLKLSVVLSLLKEAIGLQQIPPGIAIYGISIILTVFTMAPVLSDVYRNFESQKVTLETPHLLSVLDTKVIPPYKHFLQKHADPKQINFFAKISHSVWPDTYQKDLPRNSLVVLLPAFTLSQLIDAFKIGLLLYLPFTAIDLIVSNILLAMGMMMVSPITISMPFKLLIFVLMGGWHKIIEQLILSYS